MPSIIGKHHGFLLILISITRMAMSDQDANPGQLEHFLFSNYSSIARPVINCSTSVTVHYKILIIQVLFVNQKEQLLHFTAWQVRNWYDEFLVWNPKDFGGIEDIRINFNKIWTPDLVVTNAIEVQETDINLKVKYTGFVTWDSPYVFKTSCQINVQYFPFDHQYCTILIGSWTFPVKEIDIMPYNYSTEFYTQNDEWILSDIHKERLLNLYPGYSSELVELCYVIKFVRRPQFYQMNIIFPSSLIFICIISVFFLPCESGEKIALNVTILLALAVNSVMINENMPPSSQSTPILGQFFLTQICCVASAIFCNAFVLAMYHSIPRPVPKLLHIAILEVLARCVFVTECTAKCSRSLCAKHAKRNVNRSMYLLKNNSSVLEYSDTLPVEVSKNCQANSFNGNNIQTISRKPSSDQSNRINAIFDEKTDINLLQSSIHRIEQSIQSYWDAEGYKGEWQRIALVLDRVFAVFYFIVAVVISTYFYIAIKIGALHQEKSFDELC